ncbi:MAG: transposase [Peptococcaceae bacterium]|nr:transposase [Peptococcaceae bacterium]
MQFGLEQMLNMVLEGMNSDLTTDELCQKYGIKRQTYYKWRKKLIRAGLDLLQAQMTQKQGQADHLLLELKDHNKRLQQKINRLEQAKAMWELRYKWLWWRLERINDPALRELLQQLKRQLPSEVRVTDNYNIK